MHKPLPIANKILELSHENLVVEKALSDRVEHVMLNIETGFRLNSKLQDDRLVTLLTRRMQTTPENYPYLDMNRVNFNFCCFCCFCCLSPIVLN